MKILSSIPTIILLTSCLAPIEVTDNPSDFSSQKIRAAQVNCMQAPPPQMPITYKNNPVINYEDYFDCVDDEISKNVDLIIANDVSNDKVFGGDFNKVCLIDKNNCEEWEKQSKKSVAFNLANKINPITDPTKPIKKPSIACPTISSPTGISGKSNK